MGGSLQTIPKGKGKGGGLEGRGKGHSQTKWQHMVTGTTDITDIAEGVGEGLQTGPPTTPVRVGCGGREEAGEEGRGVDWPHRPIGSVL